MYDLAVYLPGGAVILVLAKAALEAITGQNFDVFTGSLQLRDGDTIGMIIHAILWLSASYLAGHLASFISTYVVEKPVHNYFGYPSAIWLDFEQQARPGSIAEDIRKIVRTTYKRSWTEGRKDIVQIGVLLIQLPALIFFAGIFKRGAFGFYSPKLPLGILGDVQAKYAAIGVSVEIKNGTRWEKIIEHHVANNCPIAYGRMYNYLVIYGALRLLSLILITLCWYIILPVYPPHTPCCH